MKARGKKGINNVNPNPIEFFATMILLETY